MKKIFLALLVGVLINIQAVTLRNGEQADPKRATEVYKTLQKVASQDKINLLIYYMLCQACKSEQPELCDITKIDFDKHFDGADEMLLKKIDKLNNLGIARDNKIDKETQNIVISSCTGTGDPKLIGMFIGLTNPVIRK